MHMATILHWQHYLPPMEEWTAYMDRDLANMRRIGFNSLAAHVDWCDIETAPGQFRFERLDRLMDLAGKHRLRVLLWPWPELQPEWVTQVHPDSQMIASDGYRPDQACWDHPAVRQLVERFVGTVVGRYKDRPSVLAWDLGAEAGNWVSSINNPLDQTRTSRLYCYCEHTAKRYREWLRRKYKTVAKLNETWGTYYADWSHVRPIRTGIFERAQVHWVDWREFMLWNVADAQGMKAAAARRADPNHPITAHLGSWGWSYVYGSTDEYQIGRHFDVVGLSLFPYWIQYGMGTCDPSFAALYLDGVRSAGDGKPMWIEELQGGPTINGLLYRSPFPRPQDIRLWVWQSIGHGASGIFYWNWRPETTGVEAGGFGLVDYDGGLTDRAKAAGEVCDVLQKHAKLLRACRPAPAQIGIVHSPRTQIHAFGDGDEGMYLRSVRGVYRALWRAGLPADILVPEQLLRHDLKRYRILYLPFAYTLSREEAARIRSYVEDGGTLYAEMWCGFKDERTFVYEVVPGAGMAEVLHCREVATNPRAGKIRIGTKHAAIPLLDVGAEIPVFKWQEMVRTLDGADVVAAFDDGSPAVITGTYGRGRTVYVAMPLSRYFDESLQANAMKLLQGAAAWAGARPPVELRREPADAIVECRVLEAGNGRRLLIVLNHGEAGATAKLTLAGAANARVRNLLTGADVATERADAPPTISTALAPVDVQVFQVDADDAGPSNR